MTIATGIILGAESIEQAIKKAAPDGFPLSDPAAPLALVAWDVAQKIS